MKRKLRRVSLRLNRRELCALLLAICQVQRRNDFHALTRAELARARAEVSRALERACREAPKRSP